MRVALVQHDIAWEEPLATFERLRPLVAQAAAAGARLAVLTEMFGSGFSMDTDRVVEEADGPSARFLHDEARRHGLWVCGSIPTRPAGGGLPENRFVLAGPAGEEHRYAKIHPFRYGGENRCYAAGDKALTLEVEGVRVTPFVCYDLRFADLFWDAAARTDLYVGVANWPSVRREHWTALLVARAIENQAYVVAVNRVGSGGGLDYVGDSMAIDPWGRVLATASGGESVLVVDVDPEVVRATRERYPFMQDR